MDTQQQAPADREAWLTENLDRIAEKASQTYPTDNWSHMGNDEKNDWRAVVKVVAAALAHKQPWIPCSEPGAKAKRIIKAIESICDDCGHETNEDGCAYCLRTALTKAVDSMRGLLAHDWLNDADMREINESLAAIDKVLHTGGPLPTAPAAEKVPTPPEGFHIATEEERACLPDGSMFWSKLHSSWARTGTMWAEDDTLFACPNTPLLVSFTNGKINPPPYGSWHRSDWSPEMLPEGWRPLLLDEPWVKGDQIEREGWGWHTAGNSIMDALGTITRSDSRPCRTLRPLPPAPEKEKEPEWVELGPEDVAANLRFRWRGGMGSMELLPVALQPKMGALLYAHHNPLMLTWYDWRQLFNSAEISRDNGKTWEPCKKIKQL